MNFKHLIQTLATAATLLLAQPVTADTYYFHNDHLGTPQALTDTAGAVVWQGSYSPFGEATESTAEVEQNIRFPGQYFEEETGLHYNYYRDYDPTTGRYIESDLIGLGGGINTFGYGYQNPVLNTDPTGEAVPIAVVACASSPACAIISAYLFCRIMGACSVPTDGGGRERGNSDPVVHKPFNPGRDCDGNCIPCPTDDKWAVNKPGHGHPNGYWHVVSWNQDPDSCMCFPDRPSQGLDGW